MHDRLVSWCIDALHQCFLVPLAVIFIGCQKLLYNLASRYNAINPFMPSGLCYPNSLDRSFSNRRGVWLGFIITMFQRTSCIKCKQCKP